MRTSKSLESTTFYPLFLVLLFLAISNGSLAQTVYYENNFLGQKYKQGGTYISEDQVMDLLHFSAEASSRMQSALQSQGSSKVLIIGGMAIVLYPVIGSAVGGNPNFAIGLIGVGAMLVGFSINSSANAKAVEVLGIYNEFHAIKNKDAKVGYGFNIGENGLSIVMRF